MKRHMPQDIPRGHRHIRGGDGDCTPGSRQAAAVTDITGHRIVNPLATSGSGPGSSAEQMDYIFHELHADGRHALCAACGSSTGNLQRR
jgi:hypothetical protein